MSAPSPRFDAYGRNTSRTVMRRRRQRRRTRRRDFEEIDQRRAIWENNQRRAIWERQNNLGNFKQKLETMFIDIQSNLSPNNVAKFRTELGKLLAEYGKDDIRGNSIADDVASSIASYCKFPKRKTYNNYRQDDDDDDDDDNRIYLLSEKDRGYLREKLEEYVDMLS